MGITRKPGQEMMDKAKIDLSALIRHFNVHNRTEGKSPRTVEWCDEVLGMLHPWIKSEDLSTALKDLDEMVIRQFILYVQSRPGTKGASLSSHSVYNRVNALRSFFNWIYQMGYSNENILGRLRQPRCIGILAGGCEGVRSIRTYFRQSNC